MKTRRRSKGRVRRTRKGRESGKNWYWIHTNIRTAARDREKKYKKREIVGSTQNVKLSGRKRMKHERRSTQLTEDK